MTRTASSSLAFDKATVPVVMKQDTIALDRASVRSFDADGHLRVADNPISKAAINPYRGSEIPRWREHGLDPDKIYKLLRDPVELEKSAASFDGKPLLFVHKEMGSSDHDHSIVVGSVSAPYWDAPYLKAKCLSVWTDEAKRAISDETQRELSSAYRYDLDPTPGVYQGERYDGVMRNISGSHVAIVPEGRAGPDVRVYDSMEGLISMAKTAALSRTASATQVALAVYLRPKLATDAKPVDFTPTVKGLTHKNFKEKCPSIIADIKRQTIGKLANDASIEDVAEVLEALAPILPQDDPEMPAADDMEDDDAAMDDDDAALKAALKAKGYTDEEIEAICAKTVAAMDADKDDEDKADEKQGKEDKGKTAMDQLKHMVSKAAMDAALAKVASETERRVIQTQRDIRDAERAVEPRVGQIKIACDSADDVYRAALNAMGVDTKDLPAGSARAVFNAIPVTPAAPARNKIAQDAASAEGFTKRYPGAARIGHA
jgi:hypothetical protein